MQPRRAPSQPRGACRAEAAFARPVPVGGELKMRVAGRVRRGVVVKVSGWAQNCINFGRDTDNLVRNRRQPNAKAIGLQQSHPPPNCHWRSVLHQHALESLDGWTDAMDDARLRRVKLLAPRRVPTPSPSSSPRLSPSGLDLALVLTPRQTPRRTRRITTTTTASH